MGEPALPLVSYMVIRTEKMVLPLTCCRTLENRPCTLPGQYSMADPHDGGPKEHGRAGPSATVDKRERPSSIAT